MNIQEMINLDDLKFLLTPPTQKIIPVSSLSLFYLGDNLSSFGPEL